MYKEIHHINNKFKIVLIMRGEYDQNYNGIFNYTGDVLLFKLVMGTYMFITLFFILLFNKTRVKQK